MIRFGPKHSLGEPGTGRTVIIHPIIHHDTKHWITPSSTAPCTHCAISYTSSATWVWEPWSDELPMEVAAIETGGRVTMAALSCPGLRLYMSCGEEVGGM